MPCVSLQRKSSRFQEETSDIEMQLLKLGLFFEDSIYFNGTAMRNYTREWQYDSVGNILSLIHNANGNAWTRTNNYAANNNHLSSTTVGQTTVNYTYSAHGSMTSMPHLQGMQWDFAEKLSHITRGTTEAYYNYDGGGQRVRKVVEKNGVTETRLYLGGFEIWRKTVNGVLNTERETLHVMDDKKRVAIVETLTVDNSSAVANPVPVQRYQLDNHLGSASLELDDSANIVSYEEYYPYGDTSYQAGRTAGEVSQKRYRYTGKEKDEESGLYYHGARYYACWLGRWTAADPIGLVDGVNLYMYVRGNPVRLWDPSGTTTEEKVDEGKVFPTFEEVEIKGEGGASSKSIVLKNENYLKSENFITTTDAGHGDKLKKSKTQFDPGAISGTDYEKDFALKVEEQVNFWLLEFGVHNQRTRTSDITLGENEKKLEWRVNKAKQFKSSVLVSIHLDSGNKAGLFSIYKTEEDKKLGEYIAQNVVTLPLKDDGLRKDTRNLFLLRKFDTGAVVIIELGGIGDEKTKTSIKTSSSDIGKEIATGIYQYLHEGKKPEKKNKRGLTF